MTKLFFISLLLLSFPLPNLFAQDEWKEYVTIYDDFDEGEFGRSEERDILRSVSLDNFQLTRTIEISLPDDESFNGYLTAVTISRDTAEKIFSGEIPLVVVSENNGNPIYLFNYSGIRFSFSLEKPSDEVLNIVKNHYANDDRWRDPVIEHYTNSYVIRVYSAENIFEPWIEEITYNEALLMATLIGDRNQWLWGIHDSNDLLRRVYLQEEILKPDVFE